MLQVYLVLQAAGSAVRGLAALPLVGLVDNLVAARHIIGGVQFDGVQARVGNDDGVRRVGGLVVVHHLLRVIVVHALRGGRGLPLIVGLVEQVAFLLLDGTYDKGFASLHLSIGIAKRLYLHAHNLGRQGSVFGIVLVFATSGEDIAYQQKGCKKHAGKRMGRLDLGGRRVISVRGRCGSWVCRHRLRERCSCYS